jgi:hypothetical protein
MSFSEYEDCFVWTCDKCALSAEFPATSFWAAHGELKARGWRFMREEEGAWSHYCGRCAQAQREADRGLLDRPLRSVR